MDSPDDIIPTPFGGQMIPMPRWMAELSQQPPVPLTIDGKKVQVKRVSVDADPKGKAVPRLTTIYDAAKQAGIDIPILCHREYMNPVAVCRVCSVQVGFEGRPAEWRLAPACYRPAEANMIVNTHHSNERVRSSVKVLTELLLADHPTPCASTRPTATVSWKCWRGNCSSTQVARCRAPRAPAAR